MSFVVTKTKDVITYPIDGGDPVTTQVPIAWTLPKVDPALQWTKTVAMIRKITRTTAQYTMLSKDDNGADATATSNAALPDQIEMVPMATGTGQTTITYTWKTLLDAMQQQYSSGSVTVAQLKGLYAKITGKTCPAAATTKALVMIAFINDLWSDVDTSSNNAATIIANLTAKFKSLGVWGCGCPAPNCMNYDDFKPDSTLTQWVSKLGNFTVSLNASNQQVLTCTKCKGTITLI